MAYSPYSDNWIKKYTIAKEIPIVTQQIAKFRIKEALLRKENSITFYNSIEAVQHFFL